MVLFGGTTSLEKPIDAPGTKDLYVWNLKTWKWHRPDTGAVNPKRWHKFTLGVGMGDQAVFYVFNNSATEPQGPLLVLDTNLWSWTYPVVGGSALLPRTGASFAKAKTMAYLYGGVSTSAEGVVNPGGIQNDLNALDLGQKTWAPLANGPTRQGHASCYMSKLDSIVTFGGGDQNSQAFNAVLLYNITARVWNVSPQVTATSGMPGARVWHTGVCLDDKMIVFGGGNYAAGTVAPVDNDIWVLQAIGMGESFEWRRPEIKGKADGPTARMGHSAVLYENNMLVYGGVGAEGDMAVYALNLDTWTWSKPNDKSYNDSIYGSNINGQDSNRLITVVAVVSALFGVLVIGVLGAIGMKNWRRRKGSESGMGMDASFSGNRSDQMGPMVQRKESSNASLKRASAFSPIRDSMLQDFPLPYPSEVYGKRASWGVHCVPEDMDFRRQSYMPQQHPGVILAAIDEMRTKTSSGSFRLSMREEVSPLERLSLLTSSTSLIDSPNDNIRIRDSVMREHVEGYLLPSSVPNSARNTLFVTNAVSAHSSMTDLDLVAQEDYEEPTVLLEMGADKIVVGMVLFSKYELLGSLTSPRPDYYTMALASDPVDNNALVRFYHDQHVWQHEVDLFKQLKSEYVVHVQQVYTLSNESQRQERWIAVLDDYGTLASEASLFDLSLEEKLHVAQAMGHCLAWCHAQGMALNRVDLDSFAITEEGRVHVIALDAASVVDEPMNVSQAVGRFASPQIFTAQQQQHSLDAQYAHDVWSFGLVLCELLGSKHMMRRLPLSQVETLVTCTTLAVDDAAEYVWINDQFVPFTLDERDELPSHAQELLYAMLSKSPAARPSMEAVLVPPLSFA
jgi:hypothetical protein